MAGVANAKTMRSCQEVMEHHELYKRRMAYWESPSPPEKSRWRLEATPSHEDNLPMSNSLGPKEGDGKSLEDSCATAVAPVANAKTMHYLLKQYVPKGTTLSQLMDRPHYDLEWTHDDENLQQVFYCIYHEAAFIESGSKWLPNYEHVMNVEDVPGIHENMVANEEVIKCFQAIKRIVKRAECGKVEQNKVEQPEAIKVQAAVNGYFQCSINTSLLADGGDIYAELSLVSINKVLKMIKTEVGISEDNILVDGGCSYNFMMAHSTQVTGCRVYGIEYVPTKIYLAMKSILRALKEGGLRNYKIGYIPWDMYLLEALGPAMIAIFNDEAFPEPLVEHICKILLKLSM